MTNLYKKKQTELSLTIKRERNLALKYNESNIVRKRKKNWIYW